MTGSSLVLGTGILVLATGLIGDAARRAAFRMWPDNRPQELLGAVLLFTAAVVLASTALGFAGAMNGAAMLGVAFAVWVPTRIITGRPLPKSTDLGTMNRARSLDLSWAIFALGALATGGLLAAWTATALAHPRPEFDAIAFHLPVAIEWLLHGNMRFLPFLNPLAFSGQYPANAEALAVWLMMPVHRDFAVQLASLPGVALLLIGVPVAARELGARWPAAVAAGLLVTALPRSLSELVGTNMQDMVANGAFAACLAFAAADFRRPSMGSALAVGIAAGLSAGTRYSALLVLPPVLLMFLVGRLRGGLDRRVLTALSAASIGAIVCGGAWYLRNLAFTGDPVYPQSLPWHHVSAVENLVFPYVRSYFTLGFAPRAWATTLSFALTRDGPVYLLLAAAGVVVPFVGLVRRRPGWGAWSWTLVPVVVLLAVLATPGSAGYVVNGVLATDLQSLTLRYFLPALAASAVLLAVEVGRLSLSAELVSAGLVMVMAAAVGVILNAHPVLPSRHISLAASGVAFASVAALALSWRQPRARYAVLAVLAVMGTTMSPLLARHFDAQRLVSQVPFEDARLALAPADQVVAVAGFCETGGLAGPDWSRHIEYLTGRDDVIDRPLVTSYDQWAASLRTRRASVLVVAHDSCFAGIPVPQQDWAKDHPERFHRLAGPTDAVVYRVVGR